MKIIALVGTKSKYKDRLRTQLNMPGKFLKVPTRVLALILISMKYSNE